jgi:putative hydrolase of the HAD superfamily
MVRYLIFDLDDTLYPPPDSANQGIQGRTIGFIAALLDISTGEAEKLRKKKLETYGATLEWLQAEYHFEDTEGFFRQVHPASEIGEIQADPRLRPFLLSFNLPMAILTNGPLEHALRVLEFLNAADIFSLIWDINRNDFRGKPHADAYTGVLNAAGFTIEDTLFFDDNPLYVEGWEKLGGRGILVSPKEDQRLLLPNTPRINNIYEIGTFIRQG